MWFAPNIATVIDVLTRPKLRYLFGGGTPVQRELHHYDHLRRVGRSDHVGRATTVFLARLLFGRTIEWGAQARDDHEVPWSLAFRHFWPQTLIGLVPLSVLAISAPSAIPYAFLLAGGPLLSIPLAVATAAPALGRALIAIGLDRLPEETLPPPELRALELPAIELSQPGR